MNPFSSKDQMNMPVGLSPRIAFGYLQDGAVILDIRPEYETNYRAFDVPNVYLLSFSSYKEKLNEIPQEKLLIVADSVGLQSSEVAGFLVKRGFSQVAYLVGGIVAWDKYGFPLIKNLNNELHGGCACRLRPKKI